MGEIISAYAKKCSRDEGEKGLLKHTKNQTTNKKERYAGFEVHQNDGRLYIENMGCHESECS